MKNTIFNKKNIFKIFIIFSFIAMTFGCSKVFDKADDYVGPKDKARITISTGSSSRSAIAPEEYEETITSIILTGKLEGQDKGEIKKWEMQGVDDDGDGEIDYNESAYYDLFRNPIVDDLDIGNWEFTLTCYIYEIDSSDFNEIPVYEAKAEKNLKAGDNGSIRFIPAGKGRLNITLSMDDTLCEKIAEKIDDKYYIRSNYTVTVQLKTLDGTPVDGTEKNIEEFIKDGYYYYAYYENEEVPAGSYIMFLTVQENSKNEKTIATELVHVSSYLITEGESYLPSSLNESYKINYYYVVNENPVPFNEDWWVSKETIPRTFTEYDTIKLPTAEDILRDAYVDPNNSYFRYLFDGWYDKPSNGNLVDKITGQTSEKNLYAKFLPLVELTKDVLKSIEPNWTNMEYYTIPDGYTSIAANTFSECTKLKGVKIPGSISSIGDEAFNGCNMLSTVILKGNSAPSLGADVFKETILNRVYVEYDNLLVNLTDDSSNDTTINSWQERATANLLQLTDVFKSSVLTADTLGSIFSFTPGTSEGCEIPYGYTAIADGDSDNYVFKACTGQLKTVKIEKSIEKIGSYAFKSCTELYNVTLLSETPPELAATAFEGCSKLVIYVPSDVAVTKYKNAENWKKLTIQKLQGN